MSDHPQKSCKDTFPPPPGRDQRNGARSPVAAVRTGPGHCGGGGTRSAAERRGGWELRGAAPAGGAIALLSAAAALTCSRGPPGRSAD